MTIKIREKVIIPLHIDGENIPAFFYSFQGESLSPSNEHVLIEIPSDNNHAIPLLRIHSECLTGDVFSSLRCDCGYQLQLSLSLLKKNGGYLFYLRQEGRGIGLYNKLDAYKKQDEGLDTYEANESLGFKKDSRDFSFVGQVLNLLKVSKVNLISNNPEKEDSLKKFGIEVVQAIRTPKVYNEFNKNYLNAKEQLANHIFKGEH